VFAASFIRAMRKPRKRSRFEIGYGNQLVKATIQKTAIFILAAVRT
jgi:hypothetical protein